MNITHAARTPTIAGLTVTAAVGLSSCSSDDLRSDHVEDRTAATGAAAKTDHVAPSWMPDDARDVRVRLRTTGNERILVADYDVPLKSPACTRLATPGAPTETELRRAYAADDLTRDVSADAMTDHPSLTANWRPNGQERKTTMLCDRWWVSVDAGEIYAFSPELTMIAENPNAQ